MHSLLDRFPRNNQLHEVLCKVTTLNALYSTQIATYSEAIPNLVDVAKHIQQNADKIDPALAAGLPDIVDFIAAVKVSGKKDRFYFSFATKYSSWHNPNAYPIFDSKVEKYLHSFKSEPMLMQCFETGEEKWRYRHFLKLIDVFRERFGLTSFGYRELDKFLYMAGS